MVESNEKPMRTFEAVITWAEDAQDSERCVPSLRIDGNEVWRGSGHVDQFEAYKAAIEASGRFLT